MQKVGNVVNENIEQVATFDYIGFLSNIFGMLTFEMFLKIIVIYLCIVWIAIVIWVTKDIINRTNNILYQVISIFTVLIGTPLGIVVYLLIRPSKTLFEKYYEESSLEDDIVDKIVQNEVEHQAQLQVQTSQIEKSVCYQCSGEIQKEYAFCPFCSVALKKECQQCKKQLEANWHNCPFCGKDQNENMLQDEKDLTKNESELSSISEKKSDGGQEKD